MRRTNLKRLASFFAFEQPVNYKHLYIRFCRTHEGQRNVYSSWPAEATRRRLISDYWSDTVLHYLLLVTLSALLVFLLPLTDGFSVGIYVRIVIILAGLVYVPLYFTVYRPTFNLEFLPRLETVIAEYEGRERAWLDKCKQDQLTNRGLVLLFYALDKTSKANYLTPSDKCADLLHKIFGSSPDGIKKALDLIFKKDKRAKLEHRHIVEVGKSFEEAYAILEEMQFDEGIQRLKLLEQQFQRP